MAFTLTQARTYLQDYDRLNGSSRAQRIYDKMVNDALRELYVTGDFDFATRVTRLSYAEPYETGTVSCAAAGTAVTGVGTTFTAAMVGRYIRFNGEAEQYLISAYSSATSITIEAYLGPTNLSAVTYQITDERKAMPTLFRSVRSISLNRANGQRSQVYPLDWVPFHELNLMRQVCQTANDPTNYSTKWEAPVSGNIPVGYIYLYPAPTDFTIATVYYNIWNTSVSGSSDELPIPYEAEGVVRDYLLAFLWRESGRADWTTQLQKAKAEAMSCLGASRSNSSPNNMRQEWTPGPTGPLQYPVLNASTIAAIS